MVAALVDDVLFRSKIQAAASRVAREVTFVRDGDGLLPDLRALRPHLLIVDLDRLGAHAAARIEAVKRDPGLRATRVVAFVSHVHADLIAAARAAGADQVLARSAFVTRLPDLLAGEPSESGVS